MFHVADSQQDLLSNWRWLLGGLPRLLGWSSAGDLFVSDVHGTVHRLDTGEGELEPVAATLAEFERAIDDPERVEEICLLPVVRAFEHGQGVLKDNECLGFTTLPVLGGTYTVENRFRLTITEHAAFTGHLHQQLRDFPDGTQVTVKVVP